VLKYYANVGKKEILSKFSDLLVSHAAINESNKDYLEKLQTYIHLRNHLNELNQITIKYTKK
jgi:hypothetical protein